MNLKGCVGVTGAEYGYQAWYRRLLNALSVKLTMVGRLGSRYIAAYANIISPRI